MTQKDLSAIPGEVLGVPYPDWPDWCQTFKERKAYQMGVAHARAVDSDFRTWYAEAMIAGIAHVFVGMSAADVIHALADEAEKKE